MSTFAQRMPGIGTTKTATPRQIFLNSDRVQYMPGGKVIDGTLSRDTGNTGDVDVLRAGLLMGRTTTGGQYRPSILGVTTAAVTAGATTSLTVGAAVATEVARLITAAAGNVSLYVTGPGAANGIVVQSAVTATAASSTTITISSVSLPNIISGAFIQPADGAEEPITFIPDQWGLKVTDENSANMDRPFPLVPLSGGVIDSSQIVFWPSDTSLRAFIMDALSLHTFDHES